jgi:hypothetical protein
MEINFGKEYTTAITLVFCIMYNNNMMAALNLYFDAGSIAKVSDPLELGM